MEDITVLYASGLSCSDIAERVSLHPETVRMKLKRAGVVMRPSSHRKPKTIPTWAEYFSSRVRQDGDCILWTGFLDNAGYGVVTAWFANTRAHRVSYLLTHGAFDQELKVLHACDVRACVNPHHLWLGTQVDNIRDMVAKGRQRAGCCTGETHGGAKLSDEQIRRLRAERRKTNNTYEKLGLQFGVSKMTAYRACVGIAWSHIKDDEA